MSDEPKCNHCNDTGWTQFQTSDVRMGRWPCAHCETGADEQRKFKAAIASYREQMERDELKGSPNDSGQKDILKGSPDG